jgi:hypothetical protein
MDPDPTPVPTSFFNDFKDAKKNIFFFIFYNLTRHIIFSLKFCDKIMFCKNYFRKGKDPEPDPYPHLAD